MYHGREGVDGSGDHPPWRSYWSACRNRLKHDEGKLSKFAVARAEHFLSVAIPPEPRLVAGHLFVFRGSQVRILSGAPSPVNCATNSTSLGTASRNVRHCLVAALC